MVSYEDQVRTSDNNLGVLYCFDSMCRYLDKCKVGRMIFILNHVIGGNVYFDSK